MAGKDQWSYDECPQGYYSDGAYQSPEAISSVPGAEMWYRYPDCRAAHLDPLHPSRRLFVTFSSLSRSATRGRRRSLPLLGVLALGALLPATALSAGTVDGTKTNIAPGIAGFPHAVGGLGVYEPGDADPTPDAVREVGQNNTVVGTGDNADLNGTQKMWAVTDIKYHTDNGVAAIYDVQRPGEPLFDAEFTGVPLAKLTWLLQNQAALVAQAPNADVGGAALQVVVWSLADSGIGRVRFPDPLDGVGPTNDPAVNAAAVAIRAQMNAATAASALTSFTADAAIVCGAKLKIKGSPGALVALSITAGNGTLSKQQVQLDANGEATVDLTGTANGSITVQASVSSGGTVVRLDPDTKEEIGEDAHVTETHKTMAPEEFVMLVGGTTTTLKVDVSITQCPAPITPPVNFGNTPGSTAASGVGAPAPLAAVSGALVTSKAKLAVTKSGPAGATAGQVVTYTIRVKNVSKLAARGVSLRDALPGGMTLTSSARGARLRSGAVVWSIGTLAPGASRTYKVKVRIDSSIGGRRCNTAVATASNAGTARGIACTRIRAVAGAIEPAVTG